MLRWAGPDGLKWVTDHVAVGNQPSHKYFTKGPEHGMSSYCNRPSDINIIQVYYPSGEAQEDKTYLC